MSANILVVADAASRREVTASLLRNMEYEVTTTRDAQEAMQMGQLGPAGGIMHSGLNYRC